MPCIGNFAVTVENEGNKLVAVKVYSHMERHTDGVIILQNITLFKLEALQVHYDYVVCLCYF